ncbi:RND transporter [Phyllobacterium phragmitis]|uniref:RND transporter n=1 Tax=Phyllobacterium phragmitis TaxID=2670329 RepID=A0A2S9IMP2_9HYPH|nr:RND transporter [Phyllobacterium phragmitis]
MIAACVAVGPDYQKPIVSMPARWNAKTGTAVPRLGDWWKNLNDPVLDQLITDGIAGSPDVAIAKAKVRQARASYAYAGGSLYPSLDGSGSYTRSHTAGSSSRSEISSQSHTSSQSKFGFDTKWELDLFGGNLRGAEAAYYSLESADERLRDALVALIGDIATNYVQLRGTQANIAIAQRNAASQRQTVALTRNKLAAGDISRLDLLNAEALAASTEAQIPTMRIQYAGYLNTLSVLTGISTTALASMLDRPRPIPVAPSKVAVELPAELLLNRPDVRAAERDYASSTAQIGQKQAALYPGISLSGDIGTGGTRLGDIARMSTIGWSFGPSLSIPIFQGGRLNADVALAKAQRDESFVAYRKAILQALSDVENASVSLNQNRLRYIQLQKAARSSRQANTLALELYKAGSNSFLQVLTAQRDLLSAETSLTQSRADLVVSYVTLQKALGGGWNGRVDASKPEIVDGYTGPHLVKTGIPDRPS